MYKLYTDSAHAWLEVPMQELIDLGIADKISHFSYRNGKYVYLEEDCDLGIWLYARKLIVDQFQSMVKEHYSDVSIVRSYQHYYYKKGEK